MSEREGPGSVKYVEVEAAYFEQRTLRRHARVWSLWALGVGAVISGDFFGWNFGLAAGGFGGMLIATGIITAMYLGLCFSIAEMSPALPHTGGAYSFARTAMGPWGGYVTGLAENMEYLLTPAVIVVAIGGYLGAIFETPESWAPLWWAAAYAVFVGLNIWGVEVSYIRPKRNSRRASCGGGNAASPWHDACGDYCFKGAALWRTWVAAYAPFASTSTAR